MYLRKIIAEFIYKPEHLIVTNDDQPIFFIDENCLGITPFLNGKVRYVAIGDDFCPPKGSPDRSVLKFAKNKNLIMVTKDNQLAENCRNKKVPVITLPFRDDRKLLVDQILNYKSESTS